MRHRISLICLLIVAVLALAGCSIPASKTAQPLIGLTYTIQDYNAQGGLVTECTREAHSYVQGFLGYVFYATCQPAAADGYVVKDIGGTNRTIAFYANTGGNVIGRMNAGAGVVTYGIVAGTGTTAVTESDYALQTLIANGTGSGQLSYGVEAFTAPATVSRVTSFTTSRTLTNNSAGSITINEIGIYTNYYYSTNTQGQFCIIRDVLGTGQAVASTHNLAITYTISVSN